MVMLARNSDTDNAVQSVRRIQDRFNSKFKYPWVFLNEEPFTDEFKSCVSASCSPRVSPDTFLDVSQTL